MRLQLGTITKEKLPCNEFGIFPVKSTVSLGKIMLFISSVLNSSEGGCRDPGIPGGPREQLFLFFLKTLFFANSVWFATLLKKYNGTFVSQAPFFCNPFEKVQQHFSLQAPFEIPRVQGAQKPSTPKAYVASLLPGIEAQEEILTEK